MDLSTIYKLWDGPKELGRPPYNKKRRLGLFASDEYLRALQFLRDFKGKLTGTSSAKVLYLYDESGRKFLELAEVSTGDPDAGKGGRGRGTRDSKR